MANERGFFDIEEGLNAALKKVGNNYKKDEPQVDIESVVTIQDLLKQLEIDRFEKIYIATAAQENSKSQEELTSDETLDKIYTLAEYKLRKTAEQDTEKQFNQEEQEQLEAASNYYMIPHKVKQEVFVGNEKKEKEVEILIIHDVEGNSLYTVIDEKNVSLSAAFRKRIEDYLKVNYSKQIQDGQIDVQEIINAFSVKTVDQVYTLVQSGDFSLRYLPDRIDEFLVQKGIETRTNTGKDISTLEQEENLDEYQMEDKKEKDEQQQEEIEEPSLSSEGKGEVGDGAPQEEIENKKAPEEDYIHKIARINHVSPAVVNTRVIEDFDRIKEDSGIDLNGKYEPGQVVAVRIPYKFGYRTFLAEIDTGLTIDAKGFIETKENRLVNVDEFKDYFRYKITAGRDGGDTGIPLRKNENESVMTQIDEIGAVTTEKFVNNGEKQDMLLEERERYLDEVRKADEELREAIKEYEKDGSRENWIRVKNAMRTRVQIDNKYNALDNQREITDKTKENVKDLTDNVNSRIGKTERSLDDDDDWGPWSNPRSRF